MAPVDCSEDNTSSSYSDMGSCYQTISQCPFMVDTLPDLSNDECTPVSRAGSHTNNDSLFVISPKNVSANSRMQGISNIQASTSGRTFSVQCLICKEYMNTSLRSHLKIHFPTGDYTCPQCDSRFKLYSSFKLHLNRTCFEYGQHQVDADKLGEAKNLYKCDTCEET